MLDEPDFGPAGMRTGLILMTILLAACGEPARETAMPAAPAEPQFVGSAACGGCHDAEFALWRGSHHDLAMQPASEPGAVIGDFADASIEHYGITSRFLTRDGAHWVETDNADGELQEFPITHSFGVTPLQQYLVESPGGRLQVLPLAWDAREVSEGGQRWFHLYPDEQISADDPLHWTRREQNWNYMCAECHSTDLQKNYSQDTDSFATTWSEIDIGCEACHGPGSVHIDQAQRADLSGNRGLSVDLDDAGRAVWLMDTDTGIAARSEVPMRPPQQPEACGRCHSRRSVIAAEYEYGRPLADTHRPVLLEDPLYFPDGQIRDEVYVYGSFLQSRMYQSGVTCTDCHDPHSAMLVTDGPPSNVCNACHLPAKFESEEHHRHEVGDVQCVDCHMPARDYMVVDPRRDHSFRVPRPDLTLTAGAPNACNGCHDDRDAAWADAAVNSWYGDSRPAHYGQAINAGRTGEPLANQALLAAIDNDAYPGIARATALTLLRPPYSTAVTSTIRRELSNADALIRIAALGALESIQPDIRVQWAMPLLRDPVRTVRIEAVSAISPARDYLTQQYRSAFLQAEREFIAAQLAIAERPEAHGNLGNIYAEAGDAAKAESAYRSALRLEPDATAVLVNLADLYRRIDRDAEGEDLLRDGLQRNPDDAALRHSLGLLYARSERLDDALDELARAAAVDRGNSRYAYVYAIALNSAGQPDDALGVIEDAHARFPADFDIAWARVTMLRDQGRVDEVRAAAAELATRYPDMESVRDLLQSL